MRVKNSEHIVITKKFIVALLVLFISLLIINPTASAAPTTNQTINWEDSYISSNMRIRAVHLQQMRNEINSKRIAAGLPQFSFADTITAGATRVRAIHFIQIEQAIQQYYEKINSPSLPAQIQTTGWHTWFLDTFDQPNRLADINSDMTTPVDNQSPTGGASTLMTKPIKSSHMRDLREAIEKAGYCGDGFCQVYNGLDASNPSALPESCGTGKCDTDCDTDCTTVIQSCGPTACGTFTCAPGQRCRSTTCYCTTNYNCVPDAGCPVNCTAQTYTTGSCGNVTIPTTPIGSPASVNCTGSCSGSVTASCNLGGIFTGISDGCTPVCNNNGALDNGETGIDCGGGGCSACVPTCTDGIQNGTETGVDCGGSCSACAPTCTDGIQNGTETGVDCGGTCASCGQVCSDGIVQDGEQCDYGPNNGNCAGGYDCSPTCAAYYCVSQDCGNGTIEPGEECDPGLANMGPCQWGFNCSLACKNQNPANCCDGTCGDGCVDPGEECDSYTANGPCPLPCSATCTNNTSCSSCPAGIWRTSVYSHRSTGWGCFREQEGGLGGTPSGGNALQELTGCCDASSSPYPNNFRYWTSDNVDCCCPPDGAGGYLPCGCENIVVKKMVQYCI